MPIASNTGGLEDFGVAPEDAAQRVCAPNPELEAELQRYFRFRAFRSGQQQVIEHVLRGDSVLAIMQTGGGKSLCYQLPAMLLQGATLVVSPLIALMKDQIEGLPASVQNCATLVNSTLEGDEIERRLREIRAGKYKLIYAAPERLRQRPFLHALRSRGVSLLVVDEAHCVSMWGHDFRPDYLFLGETLRYLGEPAVLAMTATADPRMRVEIANHLGRQMKVVNTGTHRPNLFLESTVVRTDEDKMRELIRLCNEIEGTGIVYTRSRRKAEELSRLLRREGVRSGFYHAGLADDARAAAQEAFMDGSYRVMCATVAFGMGIDKPDVRFVVHYSLPQSLEDYYQEAGRAGRDGLMSRCILLSTPSDKANVTRWMRSELMDVDLPRRCYQLLRELTPASPFAAVHPDDFVRETQQDDTRVRVAVSMLNAVGLARRYMDVPVTANITLRPAGERAGDVDFTQFIKDAQLRVNQKLSLDTMELCERSNVRPDRIEEKLLEWAEVGWLYYRGSSRVMLLERLPAPRDAKSRLEELIDKHARAQELRSFSVFDYVETRRCRHDLIAAHFGETLSVECDSCDNCAPSNEPARKAARSVPVNPVNIMDDEKKRKILETVRALSGQVGFTGLVRILKGSVASYIRADRCRSFGVFANEPKATVERWVRQLLDEELLARDDSEYRLIFLTRSGMRELK